MPARRGASSPQAISAASPIRPPRAGTDIRAEALLSPSLDTGLDRVFMVDLWMAGELFARRDATRFCGLLGGNIP